MQNGPLDRRLQTPDSQVDDTGAADSSPLALRFHGLTNGMAEQFRVRASETALRPVKRPSVRLTPVNRLDNLP